MLKSTMVSPVTPGTGGQLKTAKASNYNIEILFIKVSVASSFSMLQWMAISWQALPHF